MRDDLESPYNLIMGCEWIGKMNGVVSTFHFMMKCPAGDGNGVVDIKGDQLMAEKCVAMEREMSLKPPQLSGNCYSETGRWKKLNSEELGIDTSMISKPTNVVLNQLKEKGYEVYLVGGCVRDLILKRTPRDFDIITSATLEQVRGIFHQCEIVGKQFPICLVHVDNTFVEVSSFKTSAPKASGLVEDDVRRPPGCNDSDYNRWRNCLERDFTMNGLMFDTCKKIVYDYLGGLEDIRKAKVRTIISAKLSFEDCARILRLVRLAARLGFQITSEIALSLKELSCSVLRLYRKNPPRNELYVSIWVWRSIYEVIVEASYFVSEGFQESNMLLKLFTNLDRYLEPDRPCHKSLWISIFAFHKAVVDQPRDPLVVATFCLAVHSGGSLLESIEKAKRISQLHDSCMSFHELPKSQKLDNVALMYQVINLATSIIAVLHKMTHEYSVPQSMSQSPQAVNLFFVPPEISEDICKIFECVRYGMERGSVPKLEKEINYELLALGNLQETRHLFGRIVLNTVYPETIVDRE
ncbi:hypothetical protein Pint_23805 [Pistacia integerrima]|uniref:Uncharacterized protein n=1 Tax=Pistacia integerrima TaxID=434235 RepID=A0ACC0YHT8_9ROSI|nr:hypothetical protein Pint_23805 [Pistacia integerrima]